MNFKTFLEAQEQPYGFEQLSGIEAIIAALRKNCSSALGAAVTNGAPQIWRGSKRAHTSGIYVPESGKRRSENSANYYTVLFDTDPKNHAYPKRARSFIASTNRASATGYSRGNDLGNELLALFPVNSTKVGMVNKRDIWLCKCEIPGFLHESLTGLNDFWNGFMQAIDQKDLIPTMTEAAALLKKHPDVAFHELEVHINVDQELTNEENVEKFADGLPEAYSLDEMGCEVVGPGAVDAENSEVWFSGPCVGVTRADWETIAKEMKL